MDSYTSSIFRSTGVSGSTVAASVSPFAPYLTAIPATATIDTTIKLAPGTVYTLPGELDIPSGGEIDGQSTYPYYSTPRAGTWLEAASSFPLAPATSAAGNVLVNMGNLSSTTAETFSAWNKLHNVGVDCMSYPWATGILEGQSQQGLDVHGNFIRDCQYGIDVENFGNGSGGAQNHGPIYGNSIAPFSQATTPVITGFQVTAAGSYTSAPTATVTGCTTNPTVTVAWNSSTGAVTGVTPQFNYGSNCNPSTAAVSFSTTSGSGAAATPVVEMLPVPVGVRMGAVNSTGGGMYYNNWVVGSDLPLNNTPAFTLDDSNEYLIDSYGESTWKGMVAGGNTSSSIGGNIILGLRVQPSNEPADTALDIANTAQNQSLLASAISVGGSAPYDITDEEPNGGQIRARVATPSGVALYVRDGQNVISSNSDIASTGMVLADSYLSCGPSCTSSQAPRQFVPLKNVGGYVQTMALSDSAQPAGIGSNGIFNSTNDTKAVAVAKSGEVPCVFDASVTVNAGDYVGVSSNSVVSGASIAGCVDLGSTTGHVVHRFRTARRRQLAPGQRADCSTGRAEGAGHAAGGQRERQWPQRSHGGTITPTWSSGAVASCTASGGSGYTASSFTTAGTGGQGGSGWLAEFSGW